MSLTSRAPPPCIAHRYRGPLPTDFWELLEHTWARGLAVQSDNARAAATTVALAASMGLISTVDPSSQDYTRRWRITALGLAALNNKERFETC